MVLENALPVLLSRLDFAWITSMHILWTPLTIGVSWTLFGLEVAWLRSGDERELCSKVVYGKLQLT